MKVLLTGATGFLGYRTLEQLALNPTIEQVIATGRTIKLSHFIQDAKIRYKLGDLTNQDFVNNLVKGVDCIIHAAALSSPWGRYKDFESANLFTHHNLIKAAQTQEIYRFVYVSTPSIYFDAQDRFKIKESDPIPNTFVNAYAATKRSAELALMSSGLPYVILRPRALIGRGDTVIMPRIIHAFREGKLKIIGNGKNIVDLTSVANAVHAIELSLVADTNGLNQIYNISNGEPGLLWESIDKVLRLLGYTFSKNKLPYKLVKTIAQVMEWKSTLTDFKEPALTCYSVGTLAKSFTMDISKARNLLHYTPAVTTDEAIEEFANWYINK